MNAAAPILAVAIYMAILFRIAWRAEAPNRPPSGAVRRQWTYALSLGVYCTSWTYFGAVGTAARSGWDYAAIYLGPILAITAFYPIWRRVAVAAKRENVGSIADFLSARYGKSRTLGALVAVVAVVGSLPYIALQLKSIATGFAVLTRGQPDATPAHGTVLALAALLAGFAILFGARRADLTEHNRGLVEAIAFESIIKLLGLLMAAAVALWVIASPAPQAQPSAFALGAAPDIDLQFIVHTLLAGAAFFCLPRQFHVGFVELDRENDARAGRPIAAMYLVLVALGVVPIVAAGASLPAAYADPDLFVLVLLIEFANPALTLFVFLGGFSAATAMVIVEAVALSAMVSNELILPWLTKRGVGVRDPGRLILFVRRAVIVAILGLAFAYFSLMSRETALASIGLIAFAALAQLAPPLFGAVLWRRGATNGAIAGLATGFSLWLLLLGLPQVVPNFDPARALGFDDPLVFGAIVSLGANLVVYVLVSRGARTSLVERIQASAFVEPSAPPTEQSRAATALDGSVGDLRELMARFLGAGAADRNMADLARELGRPLRDADRVDPPLARAVERRLAGAIGASSARGVLSAALTGAGRGAEDIARLLDETAQAVQFNRELLQATLDNMDQAVSVVDAELRLIAWNARYLQMFDFPVGFIHVGRPIADVIRLNAERGECGPGEIEEHVSRRLEHLRRGNPHAFERLRPDARVIRSVGAQMPGGGYVTTYSDVTDDRRREASLAEAARALEEANERLEARVEARTRELADAKAHAEAATESKTRFLAAASHDLLQPLNAARLFIAAIAEDAATATTAALARDADRSIAAADQLLRALLNLSKLEAGGVKPEVRAVSADRLLDELEREFAPLAAEKKLRLIVRRSGDAWVMSDRDLLRSVLQNLIANAIRYTRAGGVLVAPRRRGDLLRFEVWDTGPGIAPDRRDEIFREFTRLDASDASPGAGLGLAIVQRIAALLGHVVDLRSRVGAGSVFSVAAPVAASPPAEPTAPTRRERAGPLTGLRVLCVDNDQTILDALEALLARWGAQATSASSAEAVLTLDGAWDAALVDYHLGGAQTGLDVLEALGARAGLAALVTAETGTHAADAARARGAILIRKPVEPAVVRAFLTRAMSVAAD